MKEKIICLIGLVLCGYVLFCGVTGIRKMEAEPVAAEEYFYDGSYWKNALQVYKEPAYEAVNAITQTYDKICAFDIMGKIGRVIDRSIRNGNHEFLMELEENGAVITSGVSIVFGLAAWFLMIVFLFYFRRVLGFFLLGIPAYFSVISWKGCRKADYRCVFRGFLGGCLWGGAICILYQSRIHELCKGEKIAIAVFGILTILLAVLNVMENVSVADAVIRGSISAVLIGIYMQILYTVLGCLLYLMICEKLWIVVVGLVYIIISAGDLGGLFEGIDKAMVEITETADNIELYQLDAADRRDNTIIYGASASDREREKAIDRKQERKYYRFLKHGDADKKHKI